MPKLVLGPLLRYVGETQATVWVETDDAARVEVLVSPASGGREAAGGGHGQAPTFQFQGHHYALVLIDGLEPDRVYTYRVELDGEPVWPEPVASPDGPAFPASTIRTRRDVGRPPGLEVADFEEYTRLYWEAWGDPVLRWLLSTVPTAMIFDDHDISDDWNTSAAWVEHMRAQPWWEERITSGLASYWLYQHLGNLSPDDLGDDPVWPKVRDAGDATRVLREFAARADQEIEGTRWSYKRDFGRTRLVVIDSRCGRVLEGSRREMIDDDEFAWVEEQATGDFDHLLMATSLPYALAPAIHHLEEWNEAVAAGAWGRALAWVGEKVRQGIDLEHWAAFNDSFDRLAALVGG